MRLGEWRRSHNLDPYQHATTQKTQRKWFGTDFKGALSSQRVVFIAYAFVNDTDLIKTARYTQDDYKDVFIQMQ